MEENTKETTSTNSITKTTSTSPLKEVMTPLAIVLAGMFIGAGLYFGGDQAPSNGTLENDSVVLEGDAVQAAPSLDNVDPVTPDDHIKGNPAAPVKIVEFSDFDCPFCSRFHDTMDNIVNSYGDQVAWVYRHFPLESIHPQASAVAVASECVAKLGGNDAFWIFTDGYFEARGSGNNTAHSTLIPQLVTTAGVEQGAFTACFESGEFNANVQADLNDAIETGGRGTPWSIIIGPSGKTYPINGAVQQQVIEQLIDTALKE